MRNTELFMDLTCRRNVLLFIEIPFPHALVFCKHHTEDRSSMSVCFS